MLARENVPFSSLTLENFVNEGQKSAQLKSCKDNGGGGKEDQLFLRGKLYLVLLSSEAEVFIYVGHLYLCTVYWRGFFFWKKTCVSFQLEEFLFRASLTVKECPLLVEAGVYHRQNAFLYVDYHGTGDNIARVVFSDKEVRRHR